MHEISELKAQVLVVLDDYEHFRAIAFRMSAWTKAAGNSPGQNRTDFGYRW